jgi:DnaJ-class molecular chaperone
MITVFDCQTCGGSGTVPDGADSVEDCPTCYGDGWVDAETAAIMGWFDRSFLEQQA